MCRNQSITIRTERQHRVRGMDASQSVRNFEGIFRKRAHFARSRPDIEAWVRAQITHHQSAERENGIHDIPALADHVADDLEDRLGATGDFPQMAYAAVDDDGIAPCQSELLKRSAQHAR